VPIKCEGKLKFGAHPIGARDKHRLLVALGHFKKRSKATNASKHLRPQCGLGQRLDTVNEGVTRLDVDTGLFVVQSC
jgi:hypothetical protein